MKQQRTRRFPASLVAGVILTAVTSTATAVPIIYTDRTAWGAAILAIDAGADIRLENFNDEAITPAPGLGAGPTAFGQTSGDWTLALNDIGNGGSQTGVINPGLFDGSNDLQMLLSHDTSDTSHFGFLLMGVGVTSADVSFQNAVLGFAAEYRSSTTHDGVQINVNGVEVDLHDFYPDDTQQDGDGFLGIVDTSGISGFSFVPDTQDPNNSFEEFHLDQFEYALRGGQPPAVPEPGTLALSGLGIAWLALARRRRRRDRASMNHRR